MFIQIKRWKIKADFCVGFDATIGFMFNFTPKKAKVLAFEREKKVPLHMLFVFFPLIAFFLDNEKRVVDIAKLRPFTFYTSRKKAKYVVELPLHLARGLKIKVGDKIKFISS